MPSIELTDIELLQRIKQDDATAYQSLFERYWERLYLFAYKRLKSRQEAEDVVQHVFMKIWERRATRNITFSLQHYLYKSVSYEVISSLKDMLDRSEDISTINESILPAFNDVLEKMSVDELDVLIETEISNLPLRMQEIYRLSREKELTIREIADQLSLSEQTVKNQLTGALSRLRKPITDALVLLLISELTIW